MRFEPTGLGRWLERSTRSWKLSIVLGPPGPHRRVLVPIGRQGANVDSSSTLIEGRSVYESAMVHHLRLVESERFVHNLRGAPPQFSLFGAVGPPRHCEPTLPGCSKTRSWRTSRRRTRRRQGGLSCRGPGLFCRKSGEVRAPLRWRQGCHLSPGGRST